jgi:hypothetical protein
MEGKIRLFDDDGKGIKRKAADDIEEETDGVTPALEVRRIFND